MFNKIKPFLAEYAVEFLGSFILGSILFMSSLILGGNEPLVVATAVIILYATLVGLSKAHFNPIFTLAEFTQYAFDALKSKKFNKTQFFNYLLYIAVQFVAFLAAFSMVSGMKDNVVDMQVLSSPYYSPEEGTESLKAQYLAQIKFENTYTEGFSNLAFTVEFMASFVLALVYLANLKQNNGRAVTAFSIGLVFFVMTVFASQITGAAFNPFRALAPALSNWGENSKYMTVYVFAPVLGAMVAAVVYFLISVLKEPVKAVHEKSVTTGNSAGKKTSKKAKK